MKKSIILLSSLLFLVGCQNTTDTSSKESSKESNNPISESTSDSTSTSSSEKKDEKFVEKGFLTYDDEYSVPKLEKGGFFNDLGIDIIALVTNKTYQGTLSLTGYTDKSLTFETSVPGIIEVSGTMDGITVKGLKDGGTVLTVRDYQGLQLYTKAINVRSEKSPSELSKYIFEDVNYYYPIIVGYDTYRIAFDSTNSGIFYAKEGDLDYGTEAFTYEYGEKATVGLAEYYILNVTMSSDYATLKLKEIYLAVNGSGMVPYDSSGIAIQLFTAVF